MSSHGYVKIRAGKGHPLADPNGYAYEHRIVWASAGYPILEGQVLHHINGDKTDNRIFNLETVTRAEHNRHHNKERGRCPSTGRLLKAKVKASTSGECFAPKCECPGRKHHAARN